MRALASTLLLLCAPAALATRITSYNVCYTKLLRPSPYPAWVADQLFYQVYVDRFAPGDGPHLVQDSYNFV